MWEGRQHTAHEQPAKFSREKKMNGGTWAGNTLHKSHGRSPHNTTNKISTCPHPPDAAPYAAAGPI